VSLSTLRRELRAGELAGSYKVPGPKGDGWRIPAGALEVLGYRRLDTEPEPRPAPAEPPPELTAVLRALESLTSTLESERRQLMAA
jgi:hypothetical protein